MNLQRVTFTFEDGSEKVLEGDELAKWETICYRKSDYLLPGAPDDVLASRYDGLVRGFVPPSELAK